MVVACLLLGISGGIRFWRDRQFAALAAGSTASPFPLNELPRRMGDWGSMVSSDGQFDPEVAQVAGSSDSIVRAYLNEKTGEQMSAFVIYGLAAKVFLHTPLVCYPAAGYQLVQGPVDREMRVPGVKAPVRYRWAIYMKRSGGIGHYEEAYYTFYYNGEWLPDASGRWKAFRYHPGMFKIQLARPVSGLSDEVHEPSEGLLGAFVSEISHRTSRDAVSGAGEMTQVSRSPTAH